MCSTEHAAAATTHRCWPLLLHTSPPHTPRVYTLKPPAGGRKSRVSQYLLPATDTARDLYCSHTLSKRPMAAGAQGGEPGAKPAAHPLFADERVPTFFRRPAWSPDGAAGRGLGAAPGV